MEKQVFNTLKLDAISYEDRWAIANALRAAASRWTDWSDDIALASVAQSFKDQAAQANDFAEQFENC